jgi:hypothetical protein
MKSDRKQIQESNLLADKIEAQFIKLKKVLPAVLALIAVVVLAMLGYGIYSSMQEKEAAKGWTALYFADTDTSDLNAIASDFGGSSAGLWAKQTAGDAYMAKAMEKVYLDRDLADQYFKQALDEYKAVSEKSSDPFLKERSLYGVAQASEGTGDREQALAYYRKVALTPGTNSEFLAEVNKRANWLESKAGEEFYNWFKQNRPSAPMLQNFPPSMLPLPNSPDMQFKDLFQSTPNSINQGATDLPKIVPESKEPVSKLPESSAPITPPAEITPVTTEKPAPVEPAPVEPDPK